MPLPPNYAEMLKAWQEKYAKACADSQAKADAWLKQDLVARSKGSSPEQIEARKGVARLFCEMHFPADTPAARDARLAQIDYTQPLSPANGRTVDTGNPKASGFLGMGRKPAYLVSAQFLPKKPEDPIYALQYIPLKS
jgi:hypothetical protein